MLYQIVGTRTTLVEEIIDMSGLLCYGLMSFIPAEHPAIGKFLPGGEALTHAFPGTRNEQFGPARPSVPDFHRLFRAHTGTISS